MKSIIVNFQNIINYIDPRCYKLLKAYMSENTLFKILIFIHISMKYYHRHPEYWIDKLLFSKTIVLSRGEKDGIVDVFMHIYKDSLPIIELTFYDTDLNYFDASTIETTYGYDVTIHGIFDKSVFATLCVY